MKPVLECVIEAVLIIRRKPALPTPNISTIAGAIEIAVVISVAALAITPIAVPVLIAIPWWLDAQTR